MNSIPQAAVVTFAAEECCKCGCVFGVSAQYQRLRKEDGAFFHCPNGHPQHYTTTELQKAQRRLALMGQQLDQQAAESRDMRDQRDAAERRVTAQKGIVTRLKNKAAKGHCPCCDRLFPDLAGHMATDHPDYEGAAEPEAAADDSPTGATT